MTTPPPGRLRAAATLLRELRTPDLDEWLRWKLTDESWQPWREMEPEEAAKAAESLGLLH